MTMIAGKRGLRMELPKGTCAESHRRPRIGMATCNKEQESGRSSESGTTAGAAGWLWWRAADSIREGGSDAGGIGLSLVASVGVVEGTREGSSATVSRSNRGGCTRKGQSERIRREWQSGQPDGTKEWAESLEEW